MNRIKLVFVIVFLFLTACAPSSHESEKGTDVLAARHYEVRGEAGPIFLMTGSDDDLIALTPNLHAIFMNCEVGGQRTVDTESTINVTTYSVKAATLPKTTSHQIVRVNCGGVSDLKDLPPSVDANIVEICGTVSFAGQSMVITANSLILNHAHVQFKVAESIFVRASLLSLKGDNSIQIEQRGSSPLDITPPLSLDAGRISRTGELDLISIGKAVGGFAL